LRVGVIIPVHSFTQLVDKNRNWAYDFYRDHGHEVIVKVVCDIKDTNYIYSGKPNSLKGSIIKGLEELKEVDCINIIESDAVPNNEAARDMLSAFENFPKVGAISPVYEWQGHICYPSHSHWFTDPIYQHGVRLPGKAGIPFLFSMWNPAAISLIKDDNLPEVYFLDRELGRKVANEGYTFYRMVNCKVGHFGRGRNK
jgi:hypothetical protein